MNPEKPETSDEGKSLESNDPTAEIPQEVQQIINQLPANLQVTFKQSLYRGYWPPPDFVEAYEKILPGSAKTILDLTVFEQKQRHAWDTKLLDGGLKKLEYDNNRSKREAWFSFCISLATILACLFLVINGHDLWAGGFFVISLQQSPAM